MRTDAISHQSLNRPYDPLSMAMKSCPRNSESFWDVIDKEVCDITLSFSQLRALGKWMADVGHCPLLPLGEDVERTENEMT